jgi:2-keto-4-pentenoate hydratase/2-oxohepta-3-ene-1,7-dioic acid hydratase in catechol pathway
MRIARVEHGGATTLAVERDGALLVADGGPRTIVDLIAGGAGPDGLEARMRKPEAEPRLLAPLVPGKIVAIGLNYLDHIRETGMERPNQPLVFAKFSSSVIGPGETVVVDPALCERVDWEVELAVVVGRRLSAASEDEALAGVFGYSIANDVSARDVQFADGQWVRGKSFDTFCPLGPVVVTADEIPDPQSLPLRTRVNDELVQDSSTAEMIFGVAELLAFCSRSFTLEPGDVLLTGTPWGCGEFMEPRRSLRDADTVECEIEGIGRLANPVRVGSRQ